MQFCLGQARGTIDTVKALTRSNADRLKAKLVEHAPTKLLVDKGSIGNFLETEKYLFSRKKYFPRKAFMTNFFRYCVHLRQRNAGCH